MSGRPVFQQQRYRRHETATKLSSEDGASKGKSPYRRGADFERAVKGRFERKGYYVMKSPMSKTKIDLLVAGEICLRCGVTAIFVQCKRTGDIGSAEWNEVYEIATKHGGMPMVCYRPSARDVAYMRLDEPREFRKTGRPWTAVEIDSLRPNAAQMRLA